MDFGLVEISCVEYCFDELSTLRDLVWRFACIINQFLHRLTERRETRWEVRLSQRPALIAILLSCLGEYTLAPSSFVVASIAK